MHWPVRLLTAVPICDGHDSAINTLNIEFIRHGLEVVYLGFHRSASDIARAAVQEGVAAVGISSYNGGHIEFFRDVRKDLDRRGGAHIGLFGGGGGTISQADARRMRRQGTDEIFFAGTPLETVAGFVTKKYGRSRRRPPDYPHRRTRAAVSRDAPPRPHRCSVPRPQHDGRRRAARRPGHDDPLAARPGVHAEPGDTGDRLAAFPPKQNPGWTPYATRSSSSFWWRRWVPARKPCLSATACLSGGFW